MKTYLVADRDHNSPIATGRRTGPVPPITSFEGLV
ncbi:hypothetical protein FOPG_16235, partial [Fusarium oxysporum f. sp. conglutinans race 2 54008]